MQATTGFAAFLNPFAVQPAGQGEGMVMSAAGGAPGLDMGAASEDASQDGDFAGLLNEALAGIAGMTLPGQPVTAAAPKAEGTAVEAALPACADARPVSVAALGLELVSPEEALDQAEAPTPAGVAFKPGVKLDPATLTAPAPASTPSTPPAPAPAPSAAATDAAIAAVALVQTEARAEAEPKIQPPASPAAQAPAAAQAAVAAQVAVAVAAPAAASASVVKPAADPVKTAAKDKAAPVEETRAAPRTTTSPATQGPAAKPAQDAVTEFAVAAPDALEASDAPVAEDTPEAPVIQTAAAPSDVKPNAPLGEPARATSQTVAHLAAQIAQKLDGKTTRFDVQLNPHGLGSVDVRVEIGPRGDITAALSFDNPQAAAELRARTGELQAALEQAGFDPSRTTLSFSSGGQQGQQGLWDQARQQSEGRVWQSRAFTDLSDTPEAAPAPVRRRATSGVDVRI